MSSSTSSARAADQWTTYGNQLSKRQEGQSEREWFGPPGREYSKPFPYDNYMREHQQSRDFRLNMQMMLRDVVNGLLMRFPSAIIQVVYPLRETEALTAEFSRFDYSHGFFDEVPEEGVPRLLTATVSKERKALLRRGMAVRAEATALLTAGGLEQFRNMLATVGISAAETMTVVTVRTILADSARSKGFLERYGPRVDPIEVSRLERKQTGSVQARPDRFLALSNQARRELVDRLEGGQDGTLEMLIPGPITNYIPSEARKRSELEGVNLEVELFAGSRLAKTANTMTPYGQFSNVRMWQVPAEKSWRVAGNSMVSSVHNMMEAVQSYAEFYNVTWHRRGDTLYDGVTNTDESRRFTKGERNPILYDVEKDRLFELPFVDVLKAAMITEIPEPANCGYDLSRDDFHTNNNDGRRRVPPLYAYESKADGQNRFFKIKALGQADEHALTFDDLHATAQTSLANIVSSLGSGVDAGAMLQLSRQLFSKVANTGIPASYVAALKAANPDGFEDIRDVDATAAAAAGWPSIRQWKASSSSGTLNLPKLSAQLVSDGVSAPGGFASFYGMRALGELAETGAGGWDSGLISSAARVAAFWERVETQLKAQNAGNVWLDEALRHSWYPHYKTGAMAYAFYHDAAIPAFMEATGGATAQDAAAASSGSPYILVGAGALNNNDNTTNVAGNDTAAVAEVGTSNASLNAGPNFGSGFYGAGKSVVLKSSRHNKSLVMPADMAYAVVFYLGVNRVARKMGSKTVAFLKTVVTNLEQNAANYGVVDKLMEAVAAMDLDDARAAIGYVHAGDAQDYLARANEVLAADAASGATTGKAKKSKKDAKSLDEILQEGADHIGGESEVDPDKVLGMNSADPAIIADYEQWEANSDREAQSADYPFVSTASDPADEAVIRSVWGLFSSAGNRNVIYRGVTGDGTRLDHGLPVTAGSETTLEAALGSTKNAAARRAVLKAAAPAVQVTVGQTRVAGNWVRAPLSLSFRQAVNAAQGNSGMLPGDPSSNFLSPYAGQNATARFRNALKVSGLMESGNVEHTHLVVGAKIHEAVAAGSSMSVGSSTAHIGAGFGGAEVATAGLTGVAGRRSSRVSQARAIVEGSNFKRRISEASAISNEMLRLAYLFTLGNRCDTVESLEQAYKTNTLIPWDAIIFMPRLRLRVSSMVLLKGGEATGVNFYGDLNTMVGTQTIIKVTEVSVTLRHNAMTRNADHLMPTFNALVSGYVGGGNLQWIKQKDMAATMNASAAKAHKPGSITAVVIPMQETPSLPNEMCWRGRFTFRSNHDDVNRLHYSSARFYEKLWGLDRYYAQRNEGRIDEPFLERRNRLPQIAMRGQMIFRTPNTQSGYGIIRADSIEARTYGCYPGARDAFRGDGTYLRDIEDWETQVQTAGVNATLLTSY